MWRISQWSEGLTCYRVLRKIADRLEDLLTQEINDSTVVSEQAETDGIVNLSN